MYSWRRSGSFKPKGLAMNRKIMRSLTLATSILLLCACDHSIDERLAAKNAAEQSLGMTPIVFATKFNETLPKILSHRKDADAVRLTQLYAIDINRLHNAGEQRVFNMEVGQTHTALLGSLTKTGELRSIGVLLADRSEAARADFDLCAETTGGAFVNTTLAPMIARLSVMALEIPGQRSTEVIDARLFSMQLTPQGLLFQVEQKQ
jgi:hypothetical protein